jgi:hypothetical protein
MEGFSVVTPVTGLNRPNTGKEEDFCCHHHKPLALPFHYFAFSSLLSDWQSREKTRKQEV